MDEKEKNVKEENISPLIKNICYEMDTNKLMINDSENNHYLCDIFGRKKISFLPNITGSLNRYKRQNLLKEKNFSSIQTINIFSPNKNSPKKNNKLFKSKMNQKQIDYHPTIRRFEGYTHFPRPIGPPFVNIPNYIIKEKEKRKIIEKLNNYFDEDSAKVDVKRDNENKGISYLTSDLNEYDLIKQDTEQSLKLIRNTLDNFRKEYMLKLNLMNKDPNVKALYQFKKNLLLNKDSKIINGRILPEPPEKIRKNYKILHSLVHKTGLSYNKKYDKNNLSNIIEQKKINLRNKTLSKYDNIYNFKNISIISGKDRFNDLCNSKDFTIGRLINMDFGLSPDKINNTEDTDKNKEKKLMEISYIEKVNNANTEENKIGGIEDAYQETEETNNNNSHLLHNDINMGKVKTLDEKIKDNELSFISYMTENEKKYVEENTQNFKTIKTINRNGEHDNTLLKGYQEKERTPPSIFPKSRILKLKSNGELYRENLKLLRLTNSEAFKIQEQKELYDLKMLEKKIKISTINANNVMKGKVLKKVKK